MTVPESSLEEILYGATGGAPLERWDARNQRTLERQKDRFATYEHDDPPGPAWAHALTWVPVLEWVGFIVVGFAYLRRWLRRHSRRG